MMLGSAMVLRACLSAGLAFASPPESQPPEPPAAPDPAPAANAPAPASEGPITVTTRLTPDPAHVGDLLTLDVIVAYPRDHAINLPNSLNFAPLELVSIEPGAVESTGKDLRQRFTITLQHFEVGEAAVPSFPVTWVDPNDAVHTYAVPPHAFVVDSLLGNEADPQPRGDDPMISLEYANVRLAEIIVAVLGGLLLASLIAAAWIFMRRRDRPIYVAPPTPPHERARAQLETLARDREALVSAGAYPDYYLRLTEIAKEYLGARFGFEALDRTTEEIQDLLLGGKVQVTPLDPKAVITFLQDCDLVKFARLSPPEVETREALDAVRSMVDRTVPVAGAVPAKRGNEPPQPPSVAPPGVAPEAGDEPRAIRPQPATPAADPAEPASEPYASAPVEEARP
jgi:hypothetical protein